jgi:hypothetical protein
MSLAAGHSPEPERATEQLDSLEQPEHFPFADERASRRMQSTVAATTTAMMRASTRLMTLPPQVMGGFISRPRC